MFSSFGTPGSERIKVTALNLWEARQPFGYEELPVPPTRPPLLLYKKWFFSYCDTVSDGEGYGYRYVPPSSRGR